MANRAVGIDTTVWLVTWLNWFILASGVMAALGFVYLHFTRQKPALRLVLLIWALMVLMPYGLALVPSALLLILLVRYLRPERGGS
ncbi:MAG TPA: hypothetical protein VK008_00570 [Sphingobacteriaceae bacterium]|nr:hypothetical protein [Sphingobacteriaceae bacterium]